MYSNHFKGNPKKLHVFYMREMVNERVDKSYSKSPLKPKLFVEELERIVSDRIKIHRFEPFVQSDFELVHDSYYVNEFFNKHDPDEMTWADLQWSEDLVRSVCYTNAALYEAIKFSLSNQNQLVCAPVSGFHHASYFKGSGFCTFAGQVLASVKIWREMRKVGCYLDLDQHFGNSIEDIRPHIEDLNEAIPEWANFNPKGYNEAYIKSLKTFLEEVLFDKIKNRECHYAVWCHGADSEENDDLGGSVTAEEWVECSRIFYEWLCKSEEILGRSIPVVSCLFGGYRRDSYQSVINLHVIDHLIGMKRKNGLDVNCKLSINDKNDIDIEVTFPDRMKNL